MPMTSFCLRRTCNDFAHGSRKGCHIRTGNPSVLLEILDVSISIVRGLKSSAV